MDKLELVVNEAKVLILLGDEQGRIKAPSSLDLADNRVVVCMYRNGSGEYMKNNLGSEFSIMADGHRP